MVACFVIAAVGAPTTAQAAAKQGNAGDVWVENVGQPAGPGHQMNPHLDCEDINLWGNGLADASGDYTIDSWPPTGSMQQVYSGTWDYDTSAGGTQVLDVIDVQELIRAATASGAAPVNKQGLHFKLQFVQNPQKHKTFWVNCDVTPGNPDVDFSHACEFERVTITNSTDDPITVVIKRDGTRIDRFTVAAGGIHFSKYAAEVGEVYKVYIDGSLVATDTYRIPKRCTTSS